MRTSHAPPLTRTVSGLARGVSIDPGRLDGAVANRPHGLEGCHG
jgi:hypothetical protein